jgi:hypothetical protein
MSKPFAIWDRTIDATINAMRDAMCSWVEEDDIDGVMDAEPVVFPGGFIGLPVPDGWQGTTGPIPGGRFFRSGKKVYYAVAVRLLMPAADA